MPAVLVDTNVLVYMFDQNDAARQDRAITVVRELEQSARGRLSAQCLAEFCAVATRQLRPVLTPDQALAQVERFMRVFPVYPLTPMIVIEAVRGVRDHKLSYYDAQIWAAARLNQIPIVFSEDFHHGMLEGVRFVNPFDADFTIEEWR
jgi:predicted nucleic acid-binding protein